MCFSLTKKEILLIRETQPELGYKPKSNILTGFIDFEAEYQNYKIRDKYKLEIDFNNQKPLPLVKEINGRIEKISKAKNLKLMDLHISEDSTRGLCLCSRFKAFEYTDELKESKSPGVDFIQKLVIPFLYGISYFEKHNKFPFGEIEHSTTGLVKEVKNNKKHFKYLKQYLKIHPEEATRFISEYTDHFNLENVTFKNKKIGRNNLCPCNSGLKYKKCHLDIVFALKETLSRQHLIQSSYNRNNDFNKQK